MALQENVHAEQKMAANLRMKLGLLHLSTSMPVNVVLATSRVSLPELCRDLDSAGLRTIGGQLACSLRAYPIMAGPI